MYTFKRQQLVNGYKFQPTVINIVMFNPSSFNSVSFLVPSIFQQNHPPFMVKIKIQTWNDNLYLIRKVKDHILVRLHNSAVMNCCLLQQITPLLSQFAICDVENVYTFTQHVSYPFKRTLPSLLMSHYFFHSFMLKQVVLISRMYCSKFKASPGQRTISNPTTDWLVIC